MAEVPEPLWSPGLVECSRLKCKDIGLLLRWRGAAIPLLSTTVDHPTHLAQHFQEPTRVTPSEETERQHYCTNQYLGPPEMLPWEGQHPSSHPYTLIPLYPYTLIPFNSYTLTPLYPYTLSPLYPYTLTPLYPYTLTLLTLTLTLTPLYPYTLIPLPLLPLPLYPYTLTLTLTLITLITLLTLILITLTLIPLPSPEPNWRT